MVFICGFMILTFLRVWVIFGILVSAANNMLRAATFKVLRSKIIFFDSNPIGRILTRFSKEIVIIDMLLAPIVVFAATGLFRAFVVAIAVAVIAPYILIAVAISLVLMVIIYRIG